MLSPFADWFRVQATRAEHPREGDRRERSAMAQSALQRKLDDLEKRALAAQRCADAEFCVAQGPMERACFTRGRVRRALAGRCRREKNARRGKEGKRNQQPPRTGPRANAGLLPTLIFFLRRTLGGGSYHAEHGNRRPRGQQGDTQHDGCPGQSPRANPPHKAARRSVVRQLRRHVFPGFRCTRGSGSAW